MTIMQKNRYDLAETDKTSSRTMTALNQRREKDVRYHLREEEGRFHPRKEGRGHQRERETYLITVSDNTIGGSRWGRDSLVTGGININMGNKSPAQWNSRSRFLQNPGKNILIN